MTYCPSIFQIENYLGQMYLRVLEIKDTTESNTSAFYFDLLLSMDPPFLAWATFFCRELNGSGVEEQMLVGAVVSIVVWYLFRSHSDISCNMHPRLTHYLSHFQIIHAYYRTNWYMFKNTNASKSAFTTLKSSLWLRKVTHTWFTLYRADLD